MNHNRCTPQRAMVIVAHPDDIEFGCAGTVAQWVQDGAEVCYVLCTSGDVGIAEAGMTKARAAEIREAEQMAAAAVVGVKEVVFLREPDGLLENTLALRKKLVREIRRFKPEVVLTEDPTLYWGDGQRINHPDHRAVGGAALDAIFPAAGQPHLFEDLAAARPHKVRKVYVRDYYQGTSFVDVSGTIELQIEALKQHVSQIGAWDPAPSVREWATTTAKRGGTGMAYAESYRIITLISDEEWAKGGN